MRFHQLHGIHRIHLRGGHDQVDRHDVASGKHRRIQALGHQLKHQVAIGHDADRPGLLKGVDDHQGADVVLAHELRHDHCGGFWFNHGDRRGREVLELRSHLFATAQ